MRSLLGESRLTGLQFGVVLFQLLDAFSELVAFLRYLIDDLLGEVIE